MKYDKFVKMIVDQEHRHTYFNERSDASDQVVRKIDYLSIAQEYSLCNLILVHI